MKEVTRNREHGIALFFSIFSLLLLMAIASALILMSNTETTVNSNYRQEQIAYFGAKAGVEEARSRMMSSDPNTINGATPLPILAPTTANGAIVYIVNPGNTANSVHPWDTSANSTLFPDDELCHDGYGTTFGTIVAPDVRCDSTLLPTGTAWYKSYFSSIPFNGTASALPFKWVRVAPKLNGSVSYLTGSGASVSTSAYSVNTNSVTFPATTVICWDGAEELPLKLPAIKCSDMLTAAGAPMTTVYLVTALGVSPSGARKMVQTDVALQPTPPFPYGLYATSNACPSITFTGNNPATDSYTTAAGQTYASSHTSTGGDVGSNGSVNVGNGNIGGIVGVLAGPPVGAGTCTTPVTLGPNGAMAGTTACPSGNVASCYLPAPYVFPTPPAPNPLPPNTSYTPPSCGGRGNSGDCMVPGTYGNITENGALTLAPGTYNINSLTMQGNGSITVTPPGAVTLNIGGTGQSTPLTIAGNGITDTIIPNDFTINYAGTGTIAIAGNGTVTAIINAPNAPVTQQGNGNWYGSILSATATIGGNAFFHYDRNAALSPANNGYYTSIGFREVPY